MLSEKLRSGFITGLVIAAPLLVTLFILKLFFDWSLIIINPLVQGTQLSLYTGSSELVAQLLAAIFVLLALTALGLISRTRTGSTAIGDFGRLANLIPVFRTIYFTLRQVSNSLVEKDSRFKKVVLIEYPMEDVYSLGFITGKGPSEVNERTGNELYNVFIPNSPNPTGGEFKMMREEDMEELDMSVRKALRLVMTTGITSDESEIREI